MRISSMIAIFLSLCLTITATAADTNATTLDWHLFRTLPIQYHGRIQPLDTFARLMLFRFSGRTSIATSQGRISASHWLAQVMFAAADVDELPLFLLENPQIMQELRITYTRVRARYSYNTLAKQRQHLHQRAAIAHNTHPDKRTGLQQQLLQLYDNIETYRQLRHTLAFLQPIPSLPKILTTKFGPSPSLLDFLSWAQQLERLPKKAKADKAVLNMIKKYSMMVIRQRYSKIMTLLPPLAANQQKWSAPWEVLLQYTTARQVYPELDNLRQMYRCYRAGDWDQANTQLRQLYARVMARAGAGVDHDKIVREERYNRYDLLFYAKIAYVAAMLLCAISWLGPGRKFFYGLALATLALGFIDQSLGIIMRVQIKGRPPVANLYETILFASWMSVAMCMVLEYLYRHKLQTLALFAGSTIGAILAFIAGKYAYESDTMGVLVAVLDSNFWLALHVTTIVIGYSACLIAGVMGHIYLLFQLFAPGHARRLGEEIDRMTYGALCFASVFAFLGTVLGGFWADFSWGRFWGWDPKENGALLIVLWNAVLLHARLGGEIRQWGLAIGVILGNIIVAAAWWGVNLLNIGLHSYGFTSGLAYKLLAFIAIELAFIVAGTLLALVRVSR